ncbi:restriction endonuclease [Moritella viscosa]|uniref:Restriction endonuclease type IV Mrr domain-containing protein n=1 Tax=Moritella viscosa TaxID=80854 RepID=A0A1K9YY21_9GAMM|nr:restriction endonuclease [Moritella viscosa]SGY87513.1 Putative uncharacterized protein [Moritella viscosa]
MLSGKSHPNWRQYEWLISKIFHDNNSSMATEILHDTRIMGEYSERSRQIDILIKTNELKTMIECKCYSIPVDIKSVESFLGMFSDVKADFGILISSSGFTKSAEKRIREFQGQITLEKLDWEAAYKASFDEVSYGRISDICSHCIDQYESGKDVPGLLCWNHGFGLEIQGKISSFSISKCLKCNCHTVYCDCCGWMTIVEHDEPCCELRDEFLHSITEPR